MLSKGQNMNWTTRATRGVMRLLAVLIAMFVASFTASAGAATPAVVATILNTVASSGLPANTENSVALDACGDIYAIQGTNNGALPGGAIYEIPAGGGAATQVVAGTGSSQSWDGDYYLATDPSKTHLYVANGVDTGPSQHWVEAIPLVNCALQTSQTLFISDSNYSYSGASALTADASGNVFFAYGGSQIFKENSAFSSETTILSTTALNNVCPTIGSNQSCSINSIAVDSNQNIYFTAINVANYSTLEVSGLFEIPYVSGAYAATPTVLSLANSNTSTTGSYIQPVGVTTDAGGDLYVMDGGALYSSGTGVLYFVPNQANGATSSVSVAAQYPVLQGIGTSDVLSPGAPGNYYWMNSNTTISEVTPTASFGSVNVGNTSTSSFNLTFNSDVAPASIAVVPSGVYTNTGSGSCSATTNTVGSNCTVDITFAPSKPGSQNGSILLLDGNGNQLATVDLSGIGIGAGLTVDPGAVSALGSGYSAPKSIAMDSAGDLFIADSGANSVWTIPAGSTTPAAIGSGFNAPQGVAVDSTGNVYVADTGNDQIVEIPVVNGALSTSAQTTLIANTATLAGESLSSPEGIAIDGQGSLYIADSGNKRVLYLPYPGSGNLAMAQVLGSNLTLPSAVAVDTTGNVYVADAGSGSVYELSVPLSSGLQVTVASGYSSPSSLAADPSGALFVVDQGNRKVWRIPNVSGTFATGSAINVTGQLNASGTQIVADPYGVTLDPSGNLYVTDSMNGAAYEVARTSSTQSAGVVSPNSSGNPLTYFLESEGSAALTLGNPYEAATGDTTQFTALNGENNACTNSENMATGSSCDVQAEFAPTAYGDYTLTFDLSSNATNATNQAISFTGTAGQTATTTTALTQTSPSGPPSYDQAVTFTVSVSSATGTPAGAVNLLVDGITEQTATLTSQGTVSFTLAAGTLTGGSHTVEAEYAGGASGITTYSGSTSSALTVNVTAVPTSTTLSYATAYIAPASQPAGTSLVFTATVSSAFAGVPTGQVTFKITDANGTIATGTGALLPASGGTFQATYTYANTQSPANSAPYDVESVTATYSGDQNFEGSSSSSSSFDVSPAGGSEVTTASGATITSSANSNGTVTFTATSYGGWSGEVGFTCDPTSLPSNARCVFSPGIVEVLASTSSSTASIPPIVMSVTVNQPPQTPTASKLLWWLAAPTGLLLLFARRRVTRRGWPAVAMILGLVLLGSSAIGLTACTSGEAAYVTPAGTTTVTVVTSSTPFQAGSTTKMQSCPANSPANAPCAQQTFQVTLTVQ